MNRSELIIEKLKKLLNYHTDKQLSDYLGVSTAVLSNWKRRDTIQFKVIIEKFSDYNLDDILYDEKPNKQIVVENKQDKIAETIKNTENILTGKLTLSVHEYLEIIKELAVANHIAQTVKEQNDKLLAILDNRLNKKDDLKKDGEGQVIKTGTG